MDFTVVDDSLRTLPTRGGGRTIENPVMDKLVEGATLFIPVEPKKLAGWYQSAKRRGYKMNLRKTIVEKVNGCVIWWEKLVVETK